MSPKQGTQSHPHPLHFPAHRLLLATATKAPENQGRSWLKTEKKTQKTLNKNVLAASLSLSVASWAVADIWVSFPGAAGGQTHEVLRSLPRLAGLPVGRGPGGLTAALRDMAPLKRDTAVTVGYPRVPASVRVTALAFLT